MSTTLTNGLKLPDKGSVDWYADMQSNYTILDEAVGTIADHTTAIAGKAASSHTHTKSDVTDLLNSNFIPSANNSYDLGSSSYQWNNLYAKNYYYNGTAWGLDQANVWSNDNTIAKDTSPALRLRVTNLARGTPPSVNVTADFGVRASNDNLISQLATQITTNGNTYVYSRANDGTRDQRVGIYLDAANNTVTYRTASDGVVHLGDSSHRWKTLNGVNPGALSLPNLDSTQYDPIDFSQWNVSLGFGNNYVPQSDGWIHVNIKDSTNCSVFVFASNSNPMYAASAYGNGSQGLTGRVALMMPVRAGVTYTFMVKASSTSDIYSVKFFPCLGNV